MKISKIRGKLLPVCIMVMLFPVSLRAMAADSSRVSLRPVFDGMLQTRFEQDLEHDESRFQVRRARLGVRGNVLPGISYRVQADLCDRGKFKILDANATLSIFGPVSVTAGQMRVPFSPLASRSPAYFYFSNRSFIGKQVGNVRSVGVKGTWISGSRLRVEAGIFNSTSISDHTIWQKKLAFAGKVSYRLDNVTVEGGLESVAPYGVRANLADIYMGWRTGALALEGEYCRKHYCNSSFKGCDAFALAADYGLDLRNVGRFDCLSFQARYDGMTAHSDGKPDEEGQIAVTDPRRTRLTLGSTLSGNYLKAGVLLRVNYEKYFYPDTYAVPAGEGDKIVAEIVIRF